MSNVTPILDNASKCISTGLVPIAHPPGNDTTAEPKRASVDTGLVAAATDVLDRRTEASENKTNASLESIQPRDVETPLEATEKLVQPPREPSPHPPVQTSSSEPVDDLEF